MARHFEPPILRRHLIRFATDINFAFGRKGRCRLTLPENCRTESTIFITCRNNTAVWAVIRLHNPNVHERIPIELKIVGKWAADKLRERLENQLLGQYMLEAKFGVFLLVNRGARRDRKSWAVAGRRFGFEKLVEWLAEEARILSKSTSDPVRLEVVGIDLMLRDKPLIAKRKVVRKPKGSSAKSRLAKPGRKKNTGRRKSKAH